MEDSNLKKSFKKLILEIDTSKLDKQDIEFLEDLRKLTNYSSVEDMIKRFKKLAGIK